MVKFTDVSIEGFEESVKNIVEENDVVFVLFFGNENPETGKSWCPDCSHTQPLIHAAFAGTNAVVVKAPVGEKSDWKEQPKHPYRSPPASVTMIPTLVRWTKDGPQERLVEGEMVDLGDLTAFVNRYTSS